MGRLGGPKENVDSPAWSNWTENQDEWWDPIKSWQKEGRRRLDNGEMSTDRE